MFQCPACRQEVPRGSRFCSACAAPIATPAGDATGPYQAHPASPAFAAVAVEDGRFTPGQILADRYRVVSRLGKGGMGEVYRADDLTLGQSVALKFLPAHLAGDHDRLARFRREVALARQVSHPNVCRVYDLSEHAGQTFLTMEFIDGEDLSSVLKRLGRVPEEKGVEIARQLCAALGAVHEQGLLHRDLKPANVMLDGRGRVRLTDFGLAAGDDLSVSEVRSGTPLYQAPEQLSGREVTVRSDLYALGLVLYELFTGRRAFADSKRDVPPSKPSSHVSALDAATERVILRCLEPEPGRRPRSATEVLAGLPGGDPLAAALAAGELPSPQLVADAGGEGGLRPGVAWACLAATLLGLIAILFLSPRATLLNRVPLSEPPDALEYRAKGIVRELGYDAPGDRAHGFEADQRYLDHWKKHDASVSRWDRLGDGYPPAVYFWYRQSPEPLVGGLSLAWRGGGPVLQPLSPEDPPPHDEGMVSVKLAPDGRLLEFQAVPPTAAGAPPTDLDQAKARMARLLTLAGFEGSANVEPVVETEWAPPVFADLRLAVRPAGAANEGVRLVAAFHRGRVVAVQVRWAWTPPGSGKQPQGAQGPQGGTYAAELWLLMWSAALLAGGTVLAVYNLRRGQGDRRGAFRLTVFVLGTGLTVWLLRAHHVPAPAAEFDVLVRVLACAVVWAVWFWVSYIGLEPPVRRHWPHALISWNRLLEGRFRDPRVGRDLLVGVLAGIGFRLLEYAVVLAPPAFGRPAQTPFYWNPPEVAYFEGGRHLLAWCLEQVLAGVYVGLIYGLIGFVLVRLLVRRTWLAVLIYAALNALNFIWMVDDWLISPLFYVPALLLFTLVLVRFGLVAVSAMWCVECLLWWPITPNASAWHRESGLVVLAVIAALATYGCVTSLGGRPLFGEGPDSRE